MPLVSRDITQYAWTADHASLAITDLDVRIHMAPNIWGASFLTNWAAGQWDGGNNNSWAMTLHQNADPLLPGRPRLAVSSDGSAIIDPSEATTEFPASYAAKTAHWHRVTFDSNNGAGSRVFQYFTSEDGSSWTPLGSTITTAGTVTIFNSTAQLRTPGAAIWWGGRIYSLEVRDGIGGTIVANPDFAAQTPGTTSFVDSTGKTWTLVGTEIDTGLDPPQQISRAGTDLYFAPAAAGGDRFTPDSRAVLLYRNTNAATRRVRVVVPGSYYGQARPDVDVTVPATTGEKLVGPLDQGLANPATGKVDITYPDGVTGVTVAAVRV